MSQDIFSIKIVGSTDLSSNKPLENVGVRISVIDSSGQLIKKSKKQLCTFSQYENSKVIPQCQTRGINCNDTFSPLAKWDETFLYNEPTSTILKPHVIILFEIIDFTIHEKESYFHPLAWGFLRPQVNNPDLTTFDKQLVLQLFQYPKGFIPKFSNFQIALSNLMSNRVKLNSRLTVELSTRSKIPLIQIDKRPMNVFQKEFSTRTIDDLLEASVSDALDFTYNKDNDDSFSVLHTPKCTVPRILYNQLPVGESGALCLKFNHSGTILAAAVQVDNRYEIQIYGQKDKRPSSPIVLLNNFPAHVDIIHELAFSSDDSYLLSVSADGMAKVWNANDDMKSVSVLPHSNYIYSGKFHPLNNDIVATAGFDGTIKVWYVKTRSCIQTFQVHRTRINSLVFAPNGKHMYAGDAHGVISVWDTDIAEEGNDEFQFIKAVEEDEIKGCCITHLDMGKSNLSLLVYTQDSIVRNFETKVMVPSQRYVGAICHHFRLTCQFSPDGSYVIAGSENGSVMLWTVKGSDPIPVIEWSMKFSYPVTAIAWNPVKNMIVFSSFGAAQPILLFVSRDVGPQKRRPIPPKFPRKIVAPPKEEDSTT